MTKFEEFLSNNPKSKEELDFILKTFNPNEILNYSFSLKTIDDFVYDKKEKMSSDIYSFFKKIENYVYADTGEPLDKTSVIKDILNLDIIKIKPFLKKASLLEIESVWHILFKENHFKNVTEA